MKHYASSLNLKKFINKKNQSSGIFFKKQYTSKYSINTLSSENHIFYPFYPWEYLASYSKSIELLKYIIESWDANQSLISESASICLCLWMLWRVFKTGIDTCLAYFTSKVLQHHNDTTQDIYLLQRCVRLTEPKRRAAHNKLDESVKPCLTLRSLLKRSAPSWPAFIYEIWWGYSFY